MQTTVTSASVTFTGRGVRYGVSFCGGSGAVLYRAIVEVVKRAARLGCAVASLFYDEGCLCGIVRNAHSWSVSYATVIFRFLPIRDTEILVPQSCWKVLEQDSINSCS